MCSLSDDASKSSAVIDREPDQGSRIAKTEDRETNAMEWNVFLLVPD
jgi:hypothetical protein